MKRAKSKAKKKLSLAEQHRKLVQPAQDVAESEWLEQPEPAVDTTALRFVTTYGVCENLPS